MTATTLGVPVFPVCVYPDPDKPGEKRKEPQVKGWQNGGSVSNRKEIEQLFATRTRATHAGIPTGDRSGILVVDLDGPRAQAWAKQHPDLLPPTRIQPTQRSGGQHLYYHLPPGLGLRNSAGKIAGAVDIRADGGFVVDWSSEFAPTGKIADAPPALIEFLQAAAHSTVQVDFGASQAIPESTRNSALASVAGRLRKAGLSADAIDAALQKHNAEHCKPPLKSREVSQIARSIGKYPIDVTPPTLVGPEHARPTLAELTGVPYEAPMIIEGYLSQDAGGFVAPGGTGKSTLILYESVHIILGKPLYGRDIVRPGSTLFVTAEDSRAVVLARLNWICRCLRLSESEMQQVQRGFYVEDISASSTRLAKVDRNGGVEATEFVAELIGQYAEVSLSSVTLDPTSLIGPGETSGNDGMAELMRIARRVVNGLGAAVRLIHHVSQHVARGGIADQYAGRGGTAFADNSRSNHQLKIMNSRSFEHGGVEYVVPTEASDAALANDEVLVIFIHKMSYAKRDTTPICVLRNGFAFRDLDLERVLDTPEARAVRDADAVETVVEFIRDKKDVRISKTALSTNYLKDLRLSRDAVRKAVDEALSLGRLENAELPQSERHGMRKDYLKVTKVKS
jgi:RecA-family ATPase